MKSFSLAFILAFSSSFIIAQTNSNREYYQLKGYTFSNSEQEKTADFYLRYAYLPALKRMGISNIGVFKLKENPSDSTLKTFVLIPFQSIDQFLNLDQHLNADDIYTSAGSEYINAYFDAPPYDRIESTLLLAFSDMPIMQPCPLKSDRSKRVYELRSYQSATEKYLKTKVDMFNAGGEIKLFEKLGFNAVFYGEVISGSVMPNLMYMTTFSDQESRDAHWKSFGSSPEWKVLSSLEKYKNTVSHIEITFLYPTEYSDY